MSFPLTPFIVFVATSFVKESGMFDFLKKSSGSVAKGSFFQRVTGVLGKSKLTLANSMGSKQRVWCATNKFQGRYKLIRKLAFMALTIL